MESGTVDYGGIASLFAGFETLSKELGGIEDIQARSNYCANLFVSCFVSIEVTFLKKSFQCSTKEREIKSYET